MTTKAASGKTTIMGIGVTIDAGAIETMSGDFWFLDDFTSDDPAAQFRAFTRLLKAALGESYGDVLKELQGDEDVLSIKKVSDFANEVFKASRSLKN